METVQINSFQKSAHLSALVNSLVARYQPLLVYQFGALRQSEQFQSLFAADELTETQTHFLLVITASNKRMEHEMQDFVNGHFTAGPVIVFAHGLGTLKRCLENGNYFFNSVAKQGYLLYQLDGLLQPNELATVALERDLIEVQSHWQNRLKMARGFLIAAEKALEEGHDRVLVFLLHQVIEQVCIGLIWAFMGYKSDIHNLRRLLQICSCFSQRPLQHFMSSNTTAGDLSLIMQSYGQARYDIDFELDGASLYRLLDLAEGFVVLGEALCEGKWDMKAGKCKRDE